MRSPISRLAVSALVAILTGGAAFAGAAVVGTAPATAGATEPPPTMTVIDVSPNTPSVTRKPKPLTFTLQITNNSERPLHISISAARSDPIGSTEQLSAVIAHPKPPSPELVSPLTATTQVTVPGKGSQPAHIRTTTDTVPHDGVCLCQTDIYPFWFIGSYTVGDSSGQVTAQTYVPSFASQPKKSPVSWIWPLLDRPHRLLRSDVFLDDALAGEIGPDGRLYKLLQVVRKVSSTVPMTIVTDPDLIDELTVMAGGYLVNTANGPVPGAGAAAARAWLAQLRGALADHPLVQIVFTPFADPDVDSLIRSHMNWPAHLDTKDRERVVAALGDRTPRTDLAWPVGGRLSANTLGQLAGRGVKTVIVGDTALTGGATDPVPDALAPYGDSKVIFAVTSSPIQREVARVLDPSADGRALLPQLVARLALRVEEDGPHYVVMTPPRNLDVSVPVAVRTVEATADSTWSRPITVEDAVADPAIAHVDRGRLRPDRRSVRLGVGLLHKLRSVTNSLPLLTSMFQDAALATRIAKPVPMAVQRTASSSLLEDRDTSNAMADRLTELVSHNRRRVYIVRPTNGTYTLTSKDSLLPITVVNRLGADINVKIRIETAGGAAGLSAGDADKVWPIKANSKVQVHIPLHVDRVGKIRLIARISTPYGLSLGYGRRATPLSVRSTAIGTIGVVITILAAIALALAVIYRQVRRLRNRSDSPKEPEPPVVVAATTASSLQ